MRPTESESSIRLIIIGSFFENYLMSSYKSPIQRSIGRI